MAAAGRTRRQIRVQQRDRAVWIWIDRERRRNALNDTVLAQITAAAVQAASDASVRAVVLTGTGERTFCAGADLSAGPAVFASADDPTTAFGRLARAARGLRVPLIARVNGACVAGGMGLLALCDLAVAGEHATFSLPEAKIGVFPMQVLVYLRELLHPRHISQLCLTGEPIDARTAQQIGLVNTVVPATHLDSEVTALVRKVSQLSPAAVQRGRYAIAAMQSMSFEAALAFAEGQIALAAATADAREGLAAFAEHRAARWPSSPGEAAT